MYVNRLRLLNVKPLHRDIPDGGGALPEPARRHFVLQGANGSGKSTILEAILTPTSLKGSAVSREITTLMPSLRNTYQSRSEGSINSSSATISTS